MKLVIWLSVLTEHQLYTFSALQKFFSNQIVYVVGSQMLEAREEQGWCKPSTDGLVLEVLPVQGWWTRSCQILDRYSSAVHIFGGLWADRRFFPIIFLAQRRGLRTGLIMEPFSDQPQSYFGLKPTTSDQFKAKLRPILYWLAGFLVARRLDVVFPISEKAIKQFKYIGVKNKNIFPFGYFVPALKNVKSEYSRNIHGLRIVFVGSLIARKGVSTLLDAVRLCHSQGLEVSLDVYGPGRPELLELSDSRICYRGVIPFGKTQEVVATYDLLVLPSLHDGWGVVVNEALLQGVPVLVSDECGAKALIQSSGAGKVFPAGNVEFLADLLARAFVKPGSLVMWKKAAVAFRKKILPENAGEYFFKCLRYASGDDSEKPLSPWYTFIEDGNEHQSPPCN